MAHTGQWTSRMRMAWASWCLGAFMILTGAVGIFMDKDSGELIGAGSLMVTGVVGIIVGGKVAHDKMGKDNA